MVECIFITVFLLFEIVILKTSVSQINLQTAEKSVRILKKQTRQRKVCTGQSLFFQSIGKPINIGLPAIF